MDWDVHHGNSTNAIFYSDRSVLYFSTHQSPHYPGTGRINEVGENGAEGTKVDVPLPSGISDEGYLMAYRNIVNDPRSKGRGFYRFCEQTASPV